MTKIWDAMIAKATNREGGDSADELNPRPSPSKGTLLAAGGERTLLGPQASSGGKKADDLIPQLYPPKEKENGSPAFAASQNSLLAPPGGSSRPSGQTQGGTLALGGSSSGTGDAGSLALTGGTGSAQSQGGTLALGGSNGGTGGAGSLALTVGTGSAQSLGGTVALGGLTAANINSKKLPQIRSNPKRDAAGPAKAATKAAIQSKLNAQFAAFRAKLPTITMVHMPSPQQNAPELQALKSQTLFVQSMHLQPDLTQPRRNSGFVASQNARICPTAQIYSVNNATSGVVFTQDPQHNDYIIGGCGFGSQGGQVYLSGAVTNGGIAMVVKQWGPTQIEAVVQPGLTGVLDGWPDLIVVPAGNPPVKFPNCRFYAQRHAVPLATIPLNYAHLANAAVTDIEYCPAGNQLGGCMNWYSGPPISSVANGVDRDSGLSYSSFNPGEDVYDLSHLTPGFVIDGSPGVFWYADSETICNLWSQEASIGDSFNYSTQGYYRAFLKSSNQVAVDWGVDHCAEQWMGIVSVTNFYGAGYSLQVYVNGPIGVDPWTGQPVPVH
jgi:hypothetical protein